MIPRVDRLFVIWSIASPAKQRRFVVGELWRREDGAFSYAYSRNLEAACEAGFTLLPEFPEHGKTYMSARLFSTFSQRLPSPKRPDYERILSGWGVAPGDDPLAILALTGGVQLTDRLEVSEHRDARDDLSRPLHFRVAGEQYYRGADVLKPDDRVELRREPGNPYDGDATQVRVVAGDVVGYVPRQYAALIARHIDAGHELDAVAVRRLVLPEDRDRWVVRVQSRATSARVRAA